MSNEHFSVERNWIGRKTGSALDGRRRTPNQFRPLGRRLAIVGTTALAATMGIGGSVLMPTTSLAFNECGSIPAGPNSTRACSAPNYGTGIEYAPSSGNSVFTINIGDGTIGGASNVAAPTVTNFLGTFGQYGVVVGGGLGFPSPVTIPSAGANSSVVVNINEYSQVQGTGGGVLVWTTGSGHDATINNYGTVLTPGVGTLASGIGLTAVSEGANANITNYAAGSVNALNNAMNGYSLSGTSLVTLNNDGSLTSQRLDGISSIDPAFGILPTFGAASATNNGTIDAGRHGINLGAVGNASVTLGATSDIDAGTFTSGTGVLAFSVTGNTMINGHAASKTNSASGPGIVGLAAGTTTIDSGIVTSGSDTLTVAGFPIPGVSGGVVALSNGAATVNAHNDITTSGAYGALAFSVTGDAKITVDDIATIDSTKPSGSTGVMAVSLLGNTVIDADALSEVKSQSGPGIVGISLAGTSTVDAGIVKSGSDTVNLLGFSVPALPGLPSLSGGVLSLANGDATANAHGDIETTGSFGVLALSLTGDATTTTDENVTVDPPIGMASISFGPNASTVTNNGTQVSTLAGLLGVNLGNGTVSITNSQTGTVNATTGAGVVAIKLGTGNNTLAGSNSVVVSNDNADGGLGGVINAPNGPGVLVLAVDPLFGTANNVLVKNQNSASITGTGGLLDPAVGVIADGNVQIDNLNRSTITNTTGASGVGVAVLAGGDVTLNNDFRSLVTGNVDVASLSGDATVNNDHRSRWDFSGISVIGAADNAALNNDRGGQINGTNALLALVAGNNASIRNDRGADLNLSGLSASLMIAGNDASITNTRGGSFNMSGISANMMIAANNASITNSSGGSFSVDGITGGNFMFAGNNASITNNRGGSFSMSSLLNANVMVATADTTISNDRRGSFSLTGLASGNFMIAGNDASISNTRGGSTTFANLVDANLMVAGHDASIMNDRGGDFSMLGLAGGNFMFAGNDASITNNRGGSFTMLNLLNANVMVANNGNASITNERGGSFTLAGINGNVMVAANGNTSITNNRGADFNLLGLTGSFMAAGTDATISNSLNGTINIVGASGDFMIAGNDVTIDNDSGATINLLGLNALGFVEGGTSTLNNNSVVRVAGLGALPGVTRLLGLDRFNNAGELTMQTGVIGDLTYTSGDYFGGDGVGGSGLLSSDVYLDGAGGSSSDLLYIDGEASGTTLIAVDDLHGGPGTYDPIGTKLVFAYTAASGPAGTEFKLRDGPMDYGLYTYDLKYYFTADDPAWFLANGPNGRAFELATLPSQIQNMTATADSTWHDRTADLRDADGTSDGGGGVWAKAVGSFTGRDYDQSFTDANGTYTYNGHSDQKIGGVVGGADAVFNMDGMTALLGVSGSYMASSTDYASTGTHVGISGTGVGAYATVLKDGFFVDAIGRVQFLGVDYATAAPWADSATTNGQAYSVVVDTGYRAELGGATVEPLATVAYNRVVLDSFNLLGNSISFDNQDSLRARLGLRVSTDTASEGVTIKPFLEANVWNEFMGDNTATISGGATPLTLHDNTAGLSGEVKGGFDVVSDSGWSAFMSAQLKKNATTNTVGGQAGFRADF